MGIVIRKYEEKDLCTMIGIWNEIVEEGNAFPQEEFLTLESGAVFFAEQTYTGVAVDTETEKKYSLQGTTQGRYLTGGVPPVRFSM